MSTLPGIDSILNLCVCMCESLGVCHMCAVSRGTRRDIRSPGVQSVCELPIWVLEDELRSSGRGARAPTHHLSSPGAHV